jgi:hypothetical protein
MFASTEKVFSSTEDKTYVVCFDSKFRTDYLNTKSTDFLCALPSRIEKVKEYTLGVVNIPTYAIFAVSSSIGNNAIRIMYGDTAANNIINIIIPDGNYHTISSTTTKYSFASSYIVDTINNAINKASSPSPPPIIFSIEQSTGRSVFTYSSSSSTKSAYISVISNMKDDKNLYDDAPLTTFLGWNLGFRTAVAATATEVAASATVTSQAIAQFKPFNYVLIAIDDYSRNVNNYYTVSYSDSTCPPNIFAKLNISPTANYEYLEPLLPARMNRTRKFFGAVNLQKFRITLYDDSGRVLNLNNMDWNMELVFTCG